MKKKYKMQVRMDIDLEVDAQSFADVEERYNKIAFDFSQEMKQLPTEHDVNDWVLSAVWVNE